MDATQARARHQDRLMSLPNVTGLATDRDPTTGEGVIVVYVTRKVPVAQLKESEIIPKQVEGVPVRVDEIGEVSAQAPGDGVMRDDATAK